MLSTCETKCKFSMILVRDMHCPFLRYFVALAFMDTRYYISTILY